MTRYRYIAIDRSGREVRGELESSDAALALARVRELGYFPVDVQVAGGKDPASNRVSGDHRRSRGISRADVTTFTRQLSDLTAAGLPIDRALTVLIEQSDNKALAALLGEVQREVRGGRSLSEALALYRRQFSPMYTNMLHAGEVSGQLSEVATRLAEFLEKEQVRRSHIVSAMVYPSLLLAVATLSVVFLLAFVVPRLAGVFDDLGSDMPLPTTVLLGLTGVIGHYWWLLAGGLIAALVFGRGFATTETGRRQLDALALRIPVIGRILERVVMSRFSRALGTLLGGGVPILDALAIAGQAAANRVISDAVTRAGDLVRQGHPVAAAMEEAGRFPPVLRHMAAVGEETGELPKMLLRVADSMDFEVDAAMRRVTTALEPAIVLLTGSFVAFVVLSILLPIFQANAAVK